LTSLQIDQLTLEDDREDARVRDAVAGEHLREHELVADDRVHEAIDLVAAAREAEVRDEVRRIVLSRIGRGPTISRLKPRRKAASAAGATGSGTGADLAADCSVKRIATRSAARARGHR
jgi:hypothetical protein